MLNEIIYDIATGEETIIELGDSKITEFNKKISEAEAERISTEAEAEAKAEAKAAVLAKLGLTADEVEALFSA